MSKAAKLCYAVAVTVAIVGCVNTAANLQRETARYIGGNVSPEQVTISDIDRGVNATTAWRSLSLGVVDCTD